MAKRKFKKYSAIEKKRYYESRASDEGNSEGRRIYARNFVNGVTDDYAKVNISSAESELKKCGKEMPFTTKIGYKGYIAGMRSKLSESK